MDQISWMYLSCGKFTTGVFVKTLDGYDDLLSALRLMASGEIFIPVTDTDNVQFTKSSPREKFLSSREREVLDGLLSGHSNRQIADRIGLSEVTIKYHLKSLRSKLGARNRTHAALGAIELGIG